MTRPLRILIVEDEMTIAMMLEDMLEELGHQVVSVASRLAQAKEQAAHCAIDLAILDVNLAGQPSFAAGEMLRARGIPLFFATGYGSAGIDPVFADAVVLNKPYRIEDLDQAIAQACSAR